MSDKKLTTEDIDTLVEIVGKFGKLYYDYPVYGIDSSSVQLRTDELVRVADMLGVRVDNKIYTNPDGEKFELNWFYFNEVKFNSQDEIEVKE